MQRDDQRVERETWIAASPEVVFGHFTDPERMTRWMGRTAELEPWPGGAFRVDYNGSDIVAGRYLAVEEGHRVVLTWGWEAAGDPVPPGSSTVEVTVEAERDGTVLRLVHSGLPTAEARTSHEEGWDYFLPRLAAAVRGD